MKKQQVVKSFLSFPFEKKSKREKVSSQAETANKEHQDSFYQECEHPRQDLKKISAMFLDIVFPMDVEDIFDIFTSPKVGR